MSALRRAARLELSGRRWCGESGGAEAVDQPEVDPPDVDPAEVVVPERSRFHGGGVANRPSPLPLPTRSRGALLSLAPGAAAARRRSLRSPLVRQLSTPPALPPALRVCRLWDCCPASRLSGRRCNEGRSRERQSPSSEPRRVLRVASAALPDPRLAGTVPRMPPTPASLPPTFPPSLFHALSWPVMTASSSPLPASPSDSDEELSAGSTGMSAQENPDLKLTALSASDERADDGESSDPVSIAMPPSEPTRWRPWASPPC